MDCCWGVDIGYGENDDVGIVVGADADNMPSHLESGYWGEVGRASNQR